MEELGGLTVILCLFIVTVISDIACVTIVSIFYTVGKDQKWHIDLQSYMVAYIAIKVAFLALRLIFIIVGWVSKNAIILVLSMIGLVLWIVIICGYYVAEVIVFLSKDNFW